MKITAVLGSPRDASISTRIAMRAIKGARDAGHKVKIYNVNEMDILGCHGCGCCRKYDTGCVIEDGM
ncbi:NAD(P)H-dependent oxidoreductase, partial [Pseudomonas aeruginosa]|nr:NAD(P)H-dependent oxidoreductase [Pseudomonas aeruginosa]